MTAVSCADAMIYAIASMYSYDDLGCHAANTTLRAGMRSLKFIDDAVAYLSPNWRRIVSQGSNSRGRLYCDTDANVLILVFTGSLPPSSALAGDPNAIDDWLFTSIPAHLGERPLQYEFAEDAADQIEKRWSDGHFDTVCGSGRPKLMLTGHSKGGGQAQYAAAKIQLDAVVFNSDIVNPVIADDGLFTAHAGSTQRFILSITGCLTGQFGGALKSYTQYLATGRIRDVRMVNDFLIKMFFRACGNNLPHAPIEWLVDTLNCSAGDHGHEIDTIIRELQACARP